MQQVVATALWAVRSNLAMRPVIGPHTGRIRPVAEAVAAAKMA
jgi:hypothetical protein